MLSKLSNPLSRRDDPGNSSDHGPPERSAGVAAALCWVLFLSLASAPAARAVINAEVSEDICPASADPCVITEPVKVASGSTLDFGSRTIRLEGSGQLDFSFGSARILCGDFLADTNGAAVNMKGVDGFGDVSGGIVRIDARSGCELHPARGCTGDSGCMLGACTTRRCTGRLTRPCADDGACALGTCFTGVCLGDPSVTCRRNQDCALGTCTETRRCQGDGSFPCDVDQDCEMGTCSLGEGRIALNGRVTGGAVEPGTLILRAGGDVEIGAPILLGSTGLESDGGTLEIQSIRGGVLLGARVDVTGGGDSTGGEVTIVAAGDITVSGPIDATGGDFDGGAIDVAAGGDVTLGQDINVNAATAAGTGGEILVEAGASLRLLAGTAANRTVLTADGHADAENLAGDGGSIDLTSGGLLHLQEFTSLLADGALPDGIGGDVYLTVGGSLLVEGRIDLGTRGAQGSGGALDLEAAGPARFTVASEIAVAGARGGGGDVDVRSGGLLELEGGVDAGASDDGAAGTIDFNSHADIDLRGSIVTSGRVGAEAITLEACRIRLAPSADVENDALQGENVFLVRESLAFAAGSRVVASDPQGRNRIIYRDEAKPPVQGGTVLPAADLVLNSRLSGCPVCGNGEIDQGELCDDGNLLDGDGCSAACIDEGCIAETGDYPDVALCDDGRACTRDRCDTVSHACVHEHLCDDLVDCTVDSCVDDACRNVPSDAACSDGNPCTEDVCVARVGCANPDNTDPCDDGLFCTVDDVCDAGVCTGTPRNCADGVSCTIDTCDDEADRCVHAAEDSLCDDGAPCNGLETCDAAGDCQEGAPVDCSPLDTACRTGACDAATGECLGLAVREGQSCDDGLFCTNPDVCRSGQCTGNPRSCADGVDCTLDTCDEGAGTCRNMLRDAFCDDGLACNGPERCDATQGCLDGAPVECGFLDSACSEGSCDPTSGNCRVDAIRQGESCDDGEVCTEADVCQDGLCVGREIPDCGICGNGRLDEGETCDDGDAEFAFGEACSSLCRFVGCGKPTASAGIRPNSTDALFILRVAVGRGGCDLAVCDVTGDNRILASDSLTALNSAVGRNTVLKCPSRS